MKRLAFNPEVILAIVALVFAEGVLACAQPAQPTPTATAPPIAIIQPTVAVQPKATAQSGAGTPTAQLKPAQQTPAAGKAAPLVSLKLAHLGATSDGGKYIAAEKGYFKEEGMDMELVRSNNIADTLVAMMASQIDIGKGALSAAVYNAVGRSVGIKIVAADASVGSGPHARSYGLVARKDLLDAGALKDYSDLKGKKVAILQLNHPNEMNLEVVLKTGKLSISDVELIAMPFPDMAVALANKAIDVAMIAEPYITLGQERGTSALWRPGHEFMPGFQQAVIMYPPQFMAEKPELARRFMVAYLKGVRDYNDAFVKNKNKGEIINIMTKYADIKDPAMYEKMAVSAVNPDGYVDASSIMDLQDWFVRKGVMKEKVDEKSLIDNQYVDYALQRLGKYQ